jgi:hypothetical protein
MQPDGTFFFSEKLGTSATHSLKPPVSSARTAGEPFEGQ